MISFRRWLKNFNARIGVINQQLTGITFILFMAVLGSIFYYIQSGSEYLVGYDSYFHIRYSQLLGHQGFIRSLPWLQFTIHRDLFIDHHLLWHYLLIPFTFGDLITGGQIATHLFFMTAGGAFYILMQKSGVKLPVSWSLAGLFASYHFLYRMSLLRVQSIALALLLIVFLLSSKKKYGWLYITSIVFVWVYDGFPMLIAVSVFFSISRWLIDGKADWKLVWVSLLGILTAMVVNPYFPKNFTSLVYNASRSLFLDVLGINVGSEWDPYNTWKMFTISVPVFLFFFLTIIYQGFVQKQSADEFTALLLNLLFFILVLKSRRFIEYWPVFATLNAALLVGKRAPSLAVFGGFLVLSPLMMNNIQDAREDLESAKNPTQFEGSATWLAENTAPGTIVFNTDWDDFPFLFFYNQSNYFIVGLDPMYLYSFDPAKSGLYRSITRGKFKDPAETIRDVFKAKYVFMDRKHDPFRKALEQDTLATLAFQDRGGMVFRIQDPLPPPPE